MTVDDSALFHGTYDPVKAREYYLRTRKLKGRVQGSQAPTPSKQPARRETTTPAPRARKAGISTSKQRRKELKAKKAELEKRLDRLREVLRQKVKDAKQLNSSAQPTKKTSSTESSSKSTTSSRSEKRDRKPETATQKRERAKKAKEAYEKEHPNTLSQDIEILQEQIKDIRAKIQKAAEGAPSRKKAGKAGQQGPVLETNHPNRRTARPLITKRKEAAQNGS